jgi:hypothetical protein
MPRRGDGDGDGGGGGGHTFFFANVVSFENQRRLSGSGTHH